MIWCWLDILMCVCVYISSAYKISAYGYCYSLHGPTLSPHFFYHIKPSFTPPPVLLHRRYQLSTFNHCTEYMLHQVTTHGSLGTWRGRRIVMWNDTFWFVAPWAHIELTILTSWSYDKIKPLERVSVGKSAGNRVKTGRKRERKRERGTRTLEYNQSISNLQHILWPR